MKTLQVLWLTIKYWAQGDQLGSAYRFSNMLVKGFKNNDNI
jgi:hypothetical protein